ncbi:hypothetical protein AFCA_010864 [Aspergillus flavus]|nr:hypothetical protein AFCA_010864 [Aspergillus flavus]
MPVSRAPEFSEKIAIQDGREDGYWVSSFKFAETDKVPGVVASGLNSGKIEFLDNPRNTSADPNAWTVYQVAKLNTPVAVVPMDITRNGLMDIVVCHDFGDTMIQANMQGGHISWFENPGRDKLEQDVKWTQHYIGRWPAMHRLQAGYFTQRTFPELIGAPVVHGREDKTTPVPIIRFQAPEKPLDAKEWRRDIVDDQHFTIIHEISARRAKGPAGLDSLLVSSREGVSWLYYDDGRWKREQIGTGEQRLPDQLDDSISPGSGDHWGTGSADIGKIGGDTFAYVAAMEPFHSTAITVYIKDNHPIYGRTWRRHVLDKYGTPTQLRHWGDGPGHYITCADVDGDGNDEILVSLFGPLNRDDDGKPTDPPEQSGRNPNKGIYCYKPIDLEHGVFAKWHIAKESSGRSAVGDFCGNGCNDLVSISYNVKDYYREANPQVALYKNEVRQPPPPRARIVGTLWGNEGMVYLPDPKKMKKDDDPAGRDLIMVANYNIRVEVHPPGSKFRPDNEEGIKVLYGRVTDIDGEWKPLGNKKFPKRYSLTTKDKYLSVSETTGAVILRLKHNGELKRQWCPQENVPVKNLFDMNDVGLGTLDLKFIRVKDTWWGADFKDAHFFNMTGFHFRFLENKQNIAHMQFWIAGPNVDCRLHDHSDNSFKELHTCLSQGSSEHNETCQGGMWAPKEIYYNEPLDEIKRLRDKCSRDRHKGCQGACLEEYLEHCPLQPLQEHGRIWHADHYGQTVYRKNKTVSYPGHTWIAGPGPYVDVWMALEFDGKLQL